eukprot:c7249_g1_i2.p1 GENE.c7249_g1_i2~~c7249_g1_i2.p1  ORF type:complete len:183 (+),score=28.02 c7249_g1_i2:54-602(+)
MCAAVDNEFFGCYLLESQSPTSKTLSYIGFTVNPCRRFRQHNGLVRGGAHKTKSGRPWEMVMIVYGFPDNRSALSFEWHWQHPEQSKAMRDRMHTLDIGKPVQRGGFGSRMSATAQIRIAMELIRLDDFRSFPLQIGLLHNRWEQHIIRCPCPPPHVIVEIVALKSFEGFTKLDENDEIEIL